MANNIIDELLELAAFEEGKWEERLAAIPAFHPRNESGGGSGGGSGAGGGGNGGDGGAGGGSGGDNDDDDDDDDDDTGGDGGTKTVDWKKMARKHEREAKKERKERERLEREANERAAADQSDHEKAVNEARAEGERAAREAADKDRRTDKLENATIKLAGRGVKITVKEDDKDVEKTVKFVDPDDAFVNIERMIRSGDIDADELFDDNGKVQTDALTEALQELVDSKPHLVAGTTNGADGAGSSTGRKVRGSADGGKGSGGSKAVSEMSTEEHFERIRQHK